jgi:hypothetical protein
MSAIRPFLAALLLLGLAVSAGAEVVRYRYGPGNGPGPLTIRPWPSGAPGEWQPFRGSSRREPYPYERRPTQLVTFPHPCTGAHVVVPLALPEDTPRVEHLPDRVSFTYDAYAVEVRFIPDGTVEVEYNSGPFRRLWLR